MSWLPLARQHRHVLGLVEDAIYSLEGDVRRLLTLENGQIARECAIFICWSIHVGIVNAQTSAFDRCLARFLLHRQLVRMSRAWSSESGSTVDLLSRYEQRCREVLATTPNIYLYERHGADTPILPVTRAGAKLFLRNLGHGHPSPHIVQRLAELLGAYFWSCARNFQPLVRTRFP